jgi:predicted ester cyclase
MNDQRAAARRITFDLFARGELALIDQLTTPGFVNHGQTPGPPEADGRANLANAVQRVRAAFPDLGYEIAHEIAEGDFVIHHLVARGTHLGPLAGAAATGRAATWREVHLMRFENGRMAEQWGVVDRLGILQQVGLAAGAPPARP